MTRSSRQGVKEFVGMVAALMAINALGIDIMLPALPMIGRSLGVTVDNQRQFIIVAYVVGFGAMQIVYGPLADRFGRRPVLLGSMALFSTVSLLATFAANFGQMVLMRLVQGMAAASSRVLAVSLLRDRYSGQEMARITSFVFVVFLAVPILAPSLGQIILYSGPWAWIFYFLAAFGGALMIWAGLRLPETLAPGFRRPLSFRALIDGSAMVLRNRRTMGYTIAQMLMFGTLIGFINSAQQIFEQVLHRPAIFAYVFAGCASSMSIGSLLNARLVGRWGARRVSQAALAAFLALSLVHLIFASVRNETLVSFALLQMATMFWFPMTGANFAAMAMEPMAAIAGTASSIQGTISTVGGALAGLLISQSFDRSTVPLARGFVICASLACCLIWWIEYGSRSHGSGADATTAR